MLVQQRAKIVGGRGGDGRGDGEGGGSEQDAKAHGGGSPFGGRSTAYRGNGRAQALLGTFMSDHVYKIVEIVGSSPTSIEDAVQRAVERASQTLREIRWFEVVETRGHVEGGRVAHYQVTLKIGFTLDG
jgi:hypothetical protein